MSKQVSTALCLCVCERYLYMILDLRKLVVLSIQMYLIHCDITVMIMVHLDTISFSR